MLLLWGVEVFKRCQQCVPLNVEMSGKSRPDWIWQLTVCRCCQPAGKEVGSAIPISKAGLPFSGELNVQSFEKLSNERDLVVML